MRGIEREGLMILETVVLNDRRKTRKVDAAGTTVKAPAALTRSAGYIRGLVENTAHLVYADHCWHPTEVHRSTRLFG